MKRFFFLALAIPALFFLSAKPLSAQEELTVEQILSAVSEQMDRGQTEGIEMDFEMKLPIVGTINSHSLTRGDRSRIDVKAEGKHSISWLDAYDDWTYEVEEGTITVTKRKSSGSESKNDINSYGDLTEGYESKIVSETPDAWVIVCKKLKSNKEKDDPKRIDLTVSKKTFLPIYFGAKVSIVTVAFKNVRIGVDEESVIFRPEDYPGITIVDKR